MVKISDDLKKKDIVSILLLGGAIIGSMWIVNEMFIKPNRDSIPQIDPDDLSRRLRIG